MSRDDERSMGALLVIFFRRTPPDKLILLFRISVLKELRSLPCGGGGQKNENLGGVKKTVWGWGWGWGGGGGVGVGVGGVGVGLGLGGWGWGWGWGGGGGGNHPTRRVISSSSRRPPLMRPLLQRACTALSARASGAAATRQLSQVRRTLVLRLPPHLEAT